MFKPLTIAACVCAAGATMATGANAQQQVQLDSAAVATIRARAVQIFPKVLLVDSKSNSAIFEFTNTGDSVAQADLSLVFAYPVTDADGHLTSPVVPNPDPSAPSLVSHIRGIPQHITLQPHQKQRVIFTVDPTNLQNGEYWATLVAKRDSVPVQVMALVNGASQMININANLVDNGAIWYRKGPMSTGLELTKQRVTIIGDTVLTACVHMHHTGTAHYAGMVTLTLRNPAGKDTVSAKFPMAVYYDIEPCWSLPVTGMPPGTYTMIIQADENRQDLPADARLPFTPVQVQVPVQIGGTPPKS